MAHFCDTRVIGCSNAVAFGLVCHGAELTDPERFAVFTDAPLHEKHRTFRIDFNKNSDNQQRQKQHNKPKKCHDSIEAPFKEEPDSVFIFHHVAWPPY